MLPVTMQASQMAAKTSLSDLQSGSDVRSQAFSPGAALGIGRCFGRWLCAESGAAANSLRVAVGQDPRESGDTLASALCQGLKEGGVSPVRVGLATTPAMFASCFLDDEAYDAGIMVTASHLPHEWNGMKFFTPSGGLNKATLAGILALDSGHDIHEPQMDAPAFPEDDFMERYTEDLITRMRSIAKETGRGRLHAERPFEGLKIAVNAGNGGGAVVVKVLQQLGADTSGSVHLAPDGTFPIHIPNPEDKFMVEETLRAVQDAEAHVGIMLDTDVDRSGLICGRTLQPLNRNRLVAAAAHMVLQRHPGGTIVTDSVTSYGVKEFIEKKGGRHLRFKKGYRNVIDKAIALNAEGVEAPLAIETSGHAALIDNTWMDDGAFLALRLVLELAAMRASAAKPDDVVLWSLIEGLHEPAESEEFRLTCSDNASRIAAAREIEKSIAQAIDDGSLKWEREEPNFEGIRVQVGKSWFSIRESLHEPKVIINAEAEDKDGIRSFLRDLHENCLQKCSVEMELSPVTKYLQA